MMMAIILFVAPLLSLVAAAASGSTGGGGGGTRVFSVADFGALDDDSTNNTAAFSACLDALIAAGGGRMVLPVSRLGIYRGKIIIPPMSSWATVEIEGGGTSPTPIVGTVGTGGQGPRMDKGLCSNCSHAVVKSLEAGGGPAPAVISVLPRGHGFSMVTVSIRKLEVRTYDNPAISGIDLGFAQQINLLNVFINTGIYSVQAAQPTHGTSGVITPHDGNGAYTMLRNVVVSGYYTGIVCNEHTDGDGIEVCCNVNGLSFAYANHASRFGRVCAQRNTYDVTVTGRHGFAIQQLDVEHAGPGQTTPANAWQKTISDINDPKDLGFGDVTYWVVEGNVGPVATFVKSGASKILARRIGSPVKCAAAGGDDDAPAAALKSDDDRCESLYTDLCAHCMVTELSGFGGSYCGGATRSSSTGGGGGGTRVFSAADFGAVPTLRKA
jgi:hypothetical protein